VIAYLYTLFRKKKDIKYKYLKYYRYLNKTMQLEDQIVLWFHGVNNTKWDMSSYSQIADINNIVEFSTILKSIDHKMFPNSMFFLMKQGVEPTWECPENKKGGTWSFKISDASVEDIWFKVGILFLTNKIFQEDSILQGISIAPKKGYYILKVWTKENGTNFNFSIDLESLGPEFCKGNSQYKKHT
jgi:hypothetical protein